MLALTKEEGVFELTLLNAEAAREQFDDILVMGVSRGIPAEIMTRLQGLWDFTKVIAGEVVAVGKIVVQRIFAFLKANPNLTVGLALGAVVGAMVTSVPFLGPLLAPLSTSLATLYGGGVGAIIDNGTVSSDPFVAAVALAQKFFELLYTIFLSIKDYFAAN